VIFYFISMMGGSSGPKAMEDSSGIELRPVLVLPDLVILNSIMSSSV
jgi:hypothetical protein